MRTKAASRRPNASISPSPVRTIPLSATGQLDHDHGALPRLRNQLQRPAMRLRQLPGQRQADPRLAAIARLLRPGGCVEDRRLPLGVDARPIRSEEHTSELQSLMRISYAVFCLKTQIIKR